MEATKKIDTAAISQVLLEGETYFKISNSDTLRPFFMSIVSDSNHWMFISSNGGLTAGRKHADKALFPYYTDDKISESTEITGSKSIFKVYEDHTVYLWEPFSERYADRYEVSRNLYKNEFGDKLIFEEINHDLKLTFRYQWSSSDLYGFVRRSFLHNHATNTRKIELLDGLQNIMPHGVPSDVQIKSSNLVDAYKRTELERNSGLGIFALSAIIVDKAEPSEALKANIAWSLGLENPLHLLSSLQVQNFRKGVGLKEEEDIKAEKGAYFIHTEILLEPGAEKEWMILADVNKDHSFIAELVQTIQNEQDLAQKVKADIALGTKRLVNLVAAADGLQCSRDIYRDTRHFSNTMFNIMRGGIFDHHYSIEKEDFTHYLAKANIKIFQAAESIINRLAETFSLSDLQELAYKTEDKDFKRLALEYMPLKFSRRHGDPSRPWNKFSINTRSEIDGSKILDYEGNWRDIFQNWEALVHSYPGFIESMIYKFLNATTFDGYNPYRVTKGGFDWEIIEPDDPWSYIGYWGDHQIIYLLKLLEFQEKCQPGKLGTWFQEPLFVYANVPYRIKAFEDILENAKDTIDFDTNGDHQIRQRRAVLGADGALLQGEQGSIYKVNFIEKLLATLLAKLSNFIPEGGIWMNTQRPEWNDANNALVGNGVSMVTLYYLRRFLQFFKGQFDASNLQEVAVSAEMANFFEAVLNIFEKHKNLLHAKIIDVDRLDLLKGLGQAASDYRIQIYENGFSGKKRTLAFKSLQQLVDIGLKYMEHSIRANKRTDHLYHAYNLMTVENEEEVSISYLSEMLEGQVAVLSSGYLSAEEALQVLDAMKSSKLFREDQYSYLLYPNKDLPRFTVKNRIPETAVNDSALLQELKQQGNTAIISQDVKGVYHFNGNFKNANDLSEALDALSTNDFANLDKTEKVKVLQVFEQVFDHKSFTGRSGTFFGYEGLGSIYWHMVSKLQLAVMECCLKAIEDGTSEEVRGRLIAHYYEINEGIGVHKSPALYGAFPIDPYSHTPAGKGAQQPGMTGQVKEDILSRFYELGVVIEEGKLSFQPALLRKEEFLLESKVFSYFDVAGNTKELSLAADSLGFTFCQIPIVFELAEKDMLEVSFGDGSSTVSNILELDKKTSQAIFDRNGVVSQLRVQLSQTELL